MDNVESLDIYQKRIDEMMRQEKAICAVYVIGLPDGGIKVRLAGGADLSTINDMLAYAIYTSHCVGLSVNDET